MTKQLISMLLSTIIGTSSMCAPSMPAQSSGFVASPTYPAAISYQDYDARAQVREQNQVEENFLQAVEDFAAKTSAPLLSGKENACYSPVSLYFALSLSAAGAHGTTQQQLLSLLGVKDATSLTDSCAKLYRQLYADNEMGSLKIANSLWMADHILGQPVTFEQDFLNTATKDFYASLYTGDLTADSTLSDMAKWVKDNTGGKITPKFQADPLALLYLMNTIYFKDQWVSQFSESRNTIDTFHLANGKTMDATFMHQTESSAISHGNGYTTAGLGLRNYGSIYFVLPDEGVSLDSLLTAERLPEIFSSVSGEYTRIIWSVPKFTYHTDLDLKKMLQSSGVTDIFDQNCANLSGMTKTAAYLSSAKQQTYIALDENGVEAAAYTELMGSATGAMPPEEPIAFTLDRPFLYFVTSNDNTPLFVGVCVQPTAAK